MSQARTFIEAFNRDKTSVRQEILDSKATDIDNKTMILRK